MRVLHVAHALPPDGTTGVEIYTDALARAQAAQGHTVAVWARGGDGTPDGELRDDAAGYLRIRVPHGHHDFTHQRFRWGMADRFRRFVAEWKPDLVHFQHLLYHSLDYPSIAAASGAATVLTLHDLWWTCPTVQRVNWRGELCTVGPGRGCLPCVWNGRRAQVVPKETIERLAALPMANRLLDLSPTADELVDWKKTSHECLGSIDVVVSPSRFVADDLQTHGIEPGEVIVLENGIAHPADEWLNAPRNDGTLRFGVIGTHRLKGAHLAVEAFRRLTGLPVELFWFGVNPNDSETANLPPNCHALPRYCPEEIDAVFARFDVLMVPSLWWENAPLVIREAWARQIPVVASNLGGMAESVRDGVDGLLFPVGDADALTALVRRLATEPELLATLRANIRPPQFFDEHLVALNALYEQAQAKPR